MIYARGWRTALKQHSVTARQRTGDRAGHRGNRLLVCRSPALFCELRRLPSVSVVTLPTLAQAINGSSINITGQSALQGDVVMCSGHPWIDVRCNGAAGGW